MCIYYDKRLPLTGIQISTCLMLLSFTLLILCFCLSHSHAIVSSTSGPEYYVSILSFVDKTQLEPGCTVLLHNKVQPLCIQSTSMFIH